jgi:hypothetical protein
MSRAGLVALGTAVLLAGATPAAAYMCPVLIKQAEDTIARVERGRTNAESRALLQEARQLVAEAKAHHQTARSKKDHDDAVRKAKTAQGLAEEAAALQEP